MKLHQTLPVIFAIAAVSSLQAQEIRKPVVEPSPDKRFEIISFREDPDFVDLVTEVRIKEVKSGEVVWSQSGGGDSFASWEFTWSPSGDRLGLSLSGKRYESVSILEFREGVFVEIDLRKKLPLKRDIRRHSRERGNGEKLLRWIDNDSAEVLFTGSSQLYEKGHRILVSEWVSYKYTGILKIGPLKEAAEIIWKPNPKITFSKSDEPSGNPVPAASFNPAEWAEGIKVEAHKPCWVVMISEAEHDDREWGWWGAWHEKKKARAYFQTPHVFTGLKPGTYTIIIYDPDSGTYDPNNGNPDEKSDGVALENVVVEAGTRKTYSFKKEQFKQWHCLSCPWLYLHNGTDYIKTTEVLKDVVGQENQTTTGFTLPTDAVVDGVVRIRLQEEKDEITYLDRCILRVNDQEVAPSCANSSFSKKLSAVDQDFVRLKKGDSIELKFAIPRGATRSTPLTLETNGYYIPDRAFLDSVYKSYLINQGNHSE